MHFNHKKHLKFKKLILTTAAAVMAVTFTVPYTTVPAQAASSKTARAKQAWNYLRDKGFSKKAAAGILGNMDQESSINPACATGSCYGLIQWAGSRKTRLIRYAAKKGTSASNMKTQLQFMVKKDCSNLKSNMAAHDSSAAEAARYFEVTYERAGTPNMARRIRLANYWLNKFA